MFKRLLSLVISVMFIMGVLAGCSGAKETSSKDESSQTQKSEESNKQKETEKEAKEPSGKLVLYSPNGKEVTDDILKLFDKKYPNIKIEMILGGTGEILARVKAEAGNPGGDIMWGGDTLTYDMNSELFETYESPTDKEMIKIDPNHKWHPTEFLPQVIMVSTQRLKDESQYPTSIKDLADPKWNEMGKIAIANPTKSGTGTTIVAGMADLYGWEFVESVLKNSEITSGSDVMFSAVKDGSVPVGFINEDLGVKWEQAGAPVKLIYPEDGITNQMGVVGIIAGAKNMDNAKLFIDFLGTKEVHEILVNVVKRRSARKDVNAEGMVNLNDYNLINSRSVSREEIMQKFDETLEKIR